MPPSAQPGSGRATAAAPPSRVSRRELLVAGAVAVAGIGLGIERKLNRGGPSYKGRVVVVGAGLAGLSAAWDLERRGWDVVVLEARQRVGGRCHTLRSFAGGQIAEGGGEYIDTTHGQMHRFVARFGLRLDDLRGSEARYDTTTSHTSAGGFRPTGNSPVPMSAVRSTASTCTHGASHGPSIPWTRLPTVHATTGAASQT
jgi:choline dehydrogenase-like flavoprotein